MMKLLKSVCKNGHLDIDIDIAKKLVQTYPDIDIYSSDLFGRTLFDHVCREGQLEVAKWLIQTYPDFSVSAKRAFNDSCEKGHIEVAKWLIQTVDPNIDINSRLFIYSPFLMACKNGHLDIVKWIFQTFQNLKIDVEELFETLCYYGRLEIMKWFLKTVNLNIYKDRKIIDKGFMTSCMNGHLELSKWLLQTFPTIDIYSNGGNGFYTMCECRQIKMVQWLATVGEYYTVEIEDGVIKKYNYNGMKHRDDIGVEKYFKNLGRRILIKHINESNRNAILFKPGTYYSQLLDSQFKIKNGLPKDEIYDGLDKKLKDYFGILNLTGSVNL